MRGTKLWPHTFLDIIQDGTIYVGVRFREPYPGPSRLDIYRSSDGGDSWELWSSVDETDVGGYLVPHDFLVAEGVVDRALLAHGTWGELSVAYADLDDPSPTWTSTVVLSSPDIDYGLGYADIDVDEYDFSSYYVYLTVTADRDEDDRSDEIWFARSTNQGTSWGTPYSISDLATGDRWYFHPQISYGSEGWVHVSYRVIEGDDSGVFYRRAASYANGGISAWDPIQIVSPIVGEGNVFNGDIEASPTDGTVMLALPRTGGYQLTTMRYSTDYGATWPESQQPIAPMYGNREGSNDIQFQPSLGAVALTGHGSPIPLEVQVSRSTLDDPETWTEVEAFCQQESESTWRPKVRTARDPSRGDRLAVVWNQFHDDVWRVYFDAEWRRDPGYPNLEAGFPVELPGWGPDAPGHGRRG